MFNSSLAGQLDQIEIDGTEEKRIFVAETETETWA